MVPPIQPAETNAPSSTGGSLTASGEKPGYGPSPRRPVADGDARTVGLHDCANHYAGRDDSAGVRSGRQRHLARVRACDRRDSACRLVHRALRSLLVSPGSLYTYANMILPPWLGAATAWSLLLAYVATASSVIGGFYQYANLLLTDATGHATSTVLLAVICAGISMWIAWRDVKISARLMLWIEAVSVFVIVIVLVLVLARHGSHLDTGQLRLRGVTGSGLRLGLVLALFSFVGFESATTLGSEARNPLKTIPRAVIQSSILGGAFFTLSAYTEVLGFRVVGQDLGSSDAPMHVLARVGGTPLLGLLIDIGALCQLVRGNARLRYGGRARADAHGSQRTCAPLAALNACAQRNPSFRDSGHRHRCRSTRRGPGGTRIDRP